MQRIPIETAIRKTMDDGMEVVVLPMPGFHKTYAALTTAYGSIDTHLPDGTRLPDGIAHFLEHQMFAMPEGDVFSQFSRDGASCNAFTSADQTTYLFTCTSNWQTHLRTLLRFVQTAYFEPANVQKECGIIDQEIRMIQDRPDWRAYQLMLQTRLQHHPWRIPIAGTVESIQEINAEWLHRCHATNYHPKQLMLVVCGNVDADAVFELTASFQASLPSRPYWERRMPRANREFADVTQLETSTNDALLVPTSTIEPIRSTFYPMQVPLAKVRIAFLDQETPDDPVGALRRQMVNNLALDWCFGNSSPRLQPLYANGLITDQFAPGFMSVPGAAMTILAGDTPDPQRMLDELHRVSEMPFSAEDEALFERIRRKAVAQWVRLRQSPEGLAQAYIRHALKGQDVFQSATVLQSIKPDEVLRRFKQMMNWQDVTMSTIGKEGEA